MKSQAHPEPLPLRAWSSAYLLGIGGAGVSGAARLLKGRGLAVQGQDRAQSAFSQSLAQEGIAVHLGDDAVLPAGVDGVLRSAAVPEDDPRIVEARRRGLPVLKYGEALAELCPSGRTLAVAGTHGKTTSSWMVHHGLAALHAAGLAPRPGALIGGTCQVLRCNAVAEEPGGWFAIEACEYDRTFLGLAPQAALVTNVEADHLDYYGNLAAIHEAFGAFLGLLPQDGLAVFGPDVPAALRASVSGRCLAVGRELTLDLIGETRGCFAFRLHGQDWSSPVVQLGVPGRFNVDNAAAALGLVVEASRQTSDAHPAELAEYAAQGLEVFRGAERRFDLWGEAGGCVVVHDYAHHPTEVRAILEASRRAYPTRAVHVLFQPHQHSRTARFLADFVESLRSADGVVVTDVYGARRHIDTRGAGAEDLVQRLNRAGVPASYGGGLTTTIDPLLHCLPPEALLLVLGAGDIDTIRNDLLEALALRRPGVRQPRH